MAVPGLPRAAECVLTSLLAENHVTSWKVTGDGSTAVFILRLSADNNTTGAPLQRKSWRRKAPCELRRDQDRAQLRHQSRQGQSTNTCVPADSSSVSNTDNNDNPHQPSDNHEIKTTATDKKLEASKLLMNTTKETVNNLKCVVQCVANHDVIQCKPGYDTRLSTQNKHGTLARQNAREAGVELVNVEQVACLPSVDVCTMPTLVNTAATCGAVEPCHSDLTAQHCDSVVMSDHSDSDMSEEEGETSIEQLAVDGGIKLNEVENCVKQLSDGRTKSRITDERRNRTFTKVVLDHRGGKAILIGESDDFLVSCDLQGQGEFVWYVKQDGRQLEPSAMQLQTCVQRWPPADSEEYGAVIDEVMGNLDILISIFRSLLN